MVKILVIAAGILWLPCSTFAETEGIPVATPRPGPMAVRPAESDNLELIPFTRPRNFFRSALLWDVEHWFTTFSYERAINNHVAWGLKFDLFDTFNNNKSLDGYGILLTRSFFTRTSFNGLMFQVGAGTYFFKAIDASSQLNRATFFAEAGVGWRFQVFRWLAFGLNFGMRYILKPDFGAITVGPFHPLRGALGADISIRI